MLPCVEKTTICCPVCGDQHVIKRKMPTNELAVALKDFEERHAAHLMTGEQSLFDDEPAPAADPNVVDAKFEALNKRANSRKVRPRRDSKGRVMSTSTDLVPASRELVPAQVHESDIPH